MTDGRSAVFPQIDFQTLVLRPWQCARCVRCPERNDDAFNIGWSHYGFRLWRQPLSRSLIAIA